MAAVTICSDYGTQENKVCHCFYGFPIYLPWSDRTSDQLSEKALQIAVKRREAKSKGVKERYTHLNAEFQRIARRDKKVFLSDQCKQIE